MKEYFIVNACIRKKLKRNEWEGRSNKHIFMKSIRCRQQLKDQSYMHIWEQLTGSSGPTFDDNIFFGNI